MASNPDLPVALLPTEANPLQHTLSLQATEAALSLALQTHALAIRMQIERKCPYASLLGDVRIEPYAGGVRLCGTVASYYLRQILLSLVMRTATGVHITDHIRVPDQY